MREYRLSGSVEGVVCKHDSYSDFSEQISVIGITWRSSLVSCGYAKVPQCLK
jgi:hypothetical protein